MSINAEYDILTSRFPCYLIIEKNIPEYREGIIFKKYILDKLDEYDGLTLFFHNKGYHSRYKENFPSHWVIISPLALRAIEC